MADWLDEFPVVNSGGTTATVEGHDWLKEFPVEGGVQSSAPPVASEVVSPEKPLSPSAAERWTSGRSTTFKPGSPEHVNEVAELTAFGAPSQSAALSAAKEIPKEARDQFLDAVHREASLRKRVSSLGTLGRAGVNLLAGAEKLGGTIAKWTGLEESPDPETARFAKQIYNARSGADPISNPEASWADPREWVVGAAGMIPELALAGGAGKVAGVATKALGAGAKAVGLARGAATAATFMPGQYDETYDSLLEKGVAPSTARWAATVSASLKGLLFANLPEALRGKVGDEITNELGQAIVKQYAKTVLLHGPVVMAGAKAIDSAIENVAQGKPVEVKQLLLDAGKAYAQSIGPMAVLAAPGAAMEGMSRRQIRSKERAAAWRSQQEAQAAPGEPQAPGAPGTQPGTPGETPGAPPTEGENRAQPIEGAREDDADRRPPVGPAVGEDVRGKGAPDEGGQGVHGGRSGEEVPQGEVGAGVHPFENVILKGMETLEPGVRNDAVVSLRDLHRAIGDQFSDKAAFDRAVIDMAKRGVLDLHKYSDTAYAKSDPKLSKDLVQDEKGNFYIGAMFGEQAKARGGPDALLSPMPNPVMAFVPRGMGEFFTSAAEQIKGMFGKSVMPQLSADPQVRIAAQAHAGAAGAAKPIVRQLFRQVFGENWKNKAFLSRFSDMLNADNVLDIHRQALVEAANAAKAGDMAQARKFTERAEAIETAHDLEDYRTTVMEAMVDPTMKAAIEGWKEHVNPYMDQLYNENKRLDPDTPQVGRGRYTGARVNLISKKRAAQWQEFQQKGSTELPENSLASSYRNPDVKRDTFMRRATGLGDYSNDLETNLMAVIGPRHNQATKIALMDSMVKAGMAVEQPPRGEAFDPPEGFKRMPMDMPVTNPDTGVTHMDERAAFWVHPDKVTELRNVLGTDMRQKPFWWAQGFTALQVASQMDTVSHTLTMWRTVANALGSTSAGMDLLKKASFADNLTAIHDMAKSATDVFRETPESLKRIADLAKRGLLRPEFETKAPGAKFLHKLDTAVRVLFDQYFDNLVKRGAAKEESRNQFMEALGNYNRRTMKSWERTIRDLGISPFLSGGKMAMGLGRRMLTGDPGFTAATREAAISARAAQLSKVVMAFAVIPPLVNYLVQGQFTGRPGTPLGAIDLGDDEKGQRRVLDIPQMIGLKRGMRLFGVPSLVEGLRQGKNANQIIGNMIQEIGQTWLHPLLGPGVSAVAKIGTGKQFDLRGKMEADKIPGGGWAQYEEHLRSTLESQNPLLYHAGAQMVGMFTGKAEGDWTDIPQKGMLRQASRSFGVTTVAAPATAAVELAHRLSLEHLGEGMTAKEKKQVEAKHTLLATLRKDPAEGAMALREAVLKSELTSKAAQSLSQHAGMSDLRWYAQHTQGVEQFKMVWDEATPEEKMDLQRTIGNRLLRAKGDDRVAYLMMMQELRGNVNAR
jgi:hypothetical protein